MHQMSLVERPPHQKWFNGLYVMFFASVEAGIALAFWDYCIDNKIDISSTPHSDRVGEDFVKCLLSEWHNPKGDSYPFSFSLREFIVDEFLDSPATLLKENELVEISVTSADLIEKAYLNGADQKAIKRFAKYVGRSFCKCFLEQNDQEVREVLDYIRQGVKL